MWELLRIDTVKALGDPLVKKILPRYVKVVEDELPANFQIAKRIVFDFDKSMSVQQLWKEHEKLMKNFYETKEVIDKRKLKIKDLDVPRFSILDLKAILVKEIMKNCELCERKCHKNRIKGEEGECKVGKDSLISSENMHMGEEAHISPSHTIFFMGCNFHCQFCQNWGISQWFEKGYPFIPGEIAENIEKRRAEGSRNVNFVGGEPTPNLFHILESLKLCSVNIPTVWNSNFYMSEKTMEILDGVIDMYLSDFKYGNDACALRLSKVPNYFKIVSRNHLLATEQAELTIRHLVLPTHVECCTKPILEWISKNIPNKCLVNIMDQYRPEFRANNFMDMDRNITREEFEKAKEYAQEFKVNFIA